MRLIFVSLILLLLNACASAPPNNTANICSMFEDRRSWYKAASRAEDRWGTPVYISMAIIEQESSFMRAPGRNAGSYSVLSPGSGLPRPMVMPRCWMKPGMSTSPMPPTGVPAVPIFRMPWTLSAGIPILLFVATVFPVRMPITSTLPTMKAMVAGHGAPTAIKAGLWMWLVMCRTPPMSIRVSIKAVRGI